MNKPFHKVTLNIPAHALGELPVEGKPVVMIDDKPIDRVQAVSLDCSVGDGFTLVTVSFLAKVQGEVFVDGEGLKQIESPA